MKLTSESAPRSTPGQTKVTNSWQRLWTTKLQTGERYFYFLHSILLYFLIIERAPEDGSHNLILFRIRILWIGFGSMMLWKKLLDLLTFFVIDILCLGRSFHCTVWSDNDLRYYWKSYLLEKDIWYCLMMIYDIFCKAYLGIDNPACRSPCNKINISQSL